MDGKYLGAEHTYIYGTLQNIKDPIITEKYTLPYTTKKRLHAAKTPFTSAYAECVFLRTYSRKREDGSKETWADCVIRVMEGVLSAFLTHYKKNGLAIDYTWLNNFAVEMTWAFFDLHWSPPGRGLWAMGTDHVSKNGSSALNNCYAAETSNLVLAASFVMDQLMCGGGLGFSCDWDGVAHPPDKTSSFVYVCDDTRQSWVACLEILVRAYVPVNGRITNKFPIFDFGKVRARGLPIRGFGGLSSGPAPLKKLLQQVEIYFDTYLAWKREESFFVFRDMVERLYAIGCYPGSTLTDEINKLKAAWKTGKKTYGKSRLVVDVMNAIGACVVAGNVRRSAEIALGDFGDNEFLELKNFEINPERCDMWMSNNTIRLSQDEDFAKGIPEIAKRVIVGGEPGVFSLRTSKHARIGDRTYGDDSGKLLNPCGEIILNSFEPCCLATIGLTKCNGKDGKLDENLLLQAARYATFYASTVTLIRHHWPESNAIVSKNRRIGVSLNGIAEFVDNYSYTYLNELCRKVYDEIRSFNTHLAAQSGVPRSIRVTCIKPEGSMACIMETSAGMHWPICRYAKRRIALSKESELIVPLSQAGYQMEQSTLDPNTVYAIFPLSSNGARPEREVSIFEQFGLASTLARHFVDNSVSFTGHFSSEREASVVEKAIAMFIPSLKAASLMPYSDDVNKKSVYKHLPFEEISREEYENLVKVIKPVKWDMSKGEDAKMQKGCTNDTCN